VDYADIDSKSRLTTFKGLKTLAEFDALLPDEEACRKALLAQRWPNGQVACPRCGNKRIITLKARPHHWVCKSGAQSIDKAGFLRLESWLLYGLTNHIPFAGNRADYHRFSAPSATNSRALIGVFVLLQSADKSFIHFDGRTIFAKHRNDIAAQDAGRYSSGEKAARLSLRQDSKPHRSNAPSRRLRVARAKPCHKNGQFLFSNLPRGNQRGRLVPSRRMRGLLDPAG
jgi:hypothetical protein